MVGNTGVPAEADTIRIGVTQTRAFMAGIRGTTTGVADAISVLVDSNGQLGTVSSSARYKQDIADMRRASNAVLELRPVIFRYKEIFTDGSRPLQYGLIAEEVAEVFPDLVVYNEAGEPETVKYRLLSVLLLNEVQKQQSELEVLRQETSNQAIKLQTLEQKVQSLSKDRKLLTRLQAQLEELEVRTRWVAQPVAQGSEDTSGLHQR